MRNIETERFVADAMDDGRGGCGRTLRICQRPRGRPNAGWKPHADKAESAQIIKELFMPHEVWAIREKRTGKIMGSIGLEPDRRREDVASREMGYSLGKAFWGGLYDRGGEGRYRLRVHAGKGANRYFGDLHRPDNQRSQRVIEKCGFVYEGRRRRGYHIYDGADRDNLCLFHASGRGGAKEKPRMSGEVRKQAKS